MEFKKLQEVMISDGWTTESLAFKSGVAVRTVTNARGGKSVSRTTFKKICKAIGRKCEEMK